FQLLDAAGPIAAFEIAARQAPNAYRLRVMAREAGLVRSSSGVSMPAEALSLRNIDTLMVVAGQGTRPAMADPKLLSALRRAPSLARRVSSVCSGSFILAAAGLLEGKRATTHWRRAGQLAKAFPNVRVEPDCIFTKDGAVWTSAGVS